jgi:hypothetical protein
MAFPDERVLEVVVDAGVCDGVVASYCAWAEASREPDLAGREDN